MYDEHDDGGLRWHAETNQEEIRMGIKASANSKEFELQPAGVHVVRCYRIIDLGTQDVEYKGQAKRQHKVLVGWIMPNVLMQEGEFAGKPMSIHKKYTLDLGDKANLRKDLQAWRGRAFTPKELEAFDITAVLGKACMMNIVHETKDNKTYANIASIMPLAGGMVAPELTEDPYFLSLEPESFSEEIFEELSDGLKEQIKKSPEYQALYEGSEPAPAPAPAPASGGRGNKRPPAPAPAFEDMDDDIPF
jgi:hypothetical protein